MYLSWQKSETPKPAWCLFLDADDYFWCISLLIPYFANLLNWRKRIHPVFTGLQICMPDPLYKPDDHRLIKGAHLLFVLSTAALDLLCCQLPFLNKTKIWMQTESFSRNSLLYSLQLTGNFWLVDLNGIWQGNHQIYFWHNERNLRRENWNNWQWEEALKSAGCLNNL